MDCVMWLRQAGNDGGNSNYKYCWLYKNPTTTSNHPHRRGILVQPTVLVIAIATVVACLAEPHRAIHVVVASFGAMRIPLVIVLTTNSLSCDVGATMILELGLENVQFTGLARLEASTSGSTAPCIALWYLPQPAHLVTTAA
jgi:hypothetical protein